MYRSIIVSCVALFGQVLGMLTIAIGAMCVDDVLDAGKHTHTHSLVHAHTN